MCFRNHRGFTLTELMIVVAIVGILAAIAIPNFLRYQLRSRRAEGATNVAAIRTSQIAHFGVHDRFVTVASPNPPGHPFTTQRQPWDYNVPGWKELGLEPEGEVYYQYWTEGGTDDEVSTFIVSAIADLDEDGAFSCWAFARPLLDGDGEPNSSLQLPAACGDGTNIDSDGAPQPISPEYNRVYLPSGDSRY